MKVCSNITSKIATMAAAPSNDTLLQRLKNGTATFQLIPATAAPLDTGLLTAAPHRFFARIGSSIGGSSPAIKKIEHYSVQKVTGDGRCMFRALVKGMALNKGIALSPREEKDDADIRRSTSLGPRSLPASAQFDVMANKRKHGRTRPQEHKSKRTTSKAPSPGAIPQDLFEAEKYQPYFPLVSVPLLEGENIDDLRMAVKEVLCDSERDRIQHEEALIAITVEESLKRYCQRINHTDFWGGESELLVLSKMCSQPIVVYIPEHEHSISRWGTGYIPIAEYGAEFKKAKKGGKARKPVKLVYSGRNHYDLLV